MMINEQYNFKYGGVGTTVVQNIRQGEEFIGKITYDLQSGSLYLKSIKFDPTKYPSEIIFKAKEEIQKKFEWRIVEEK